MINCGRYIGPIPTGTLHPAMMGSLAAMDEELHMSAPNGIDPNVAPSGPSCRECDEAGGWWLHLRRCAECGHVGCCDASPAQHATAHFRATGHPVIQSFEPGESWYWDYRSRTSLDGPTLADPQHRPVDQPSPGPAGRGPDDWRGRLNR